MTDIVKLLGNDASSLLEHTCTTIPKDNLYLRAMTLSPA